MFCKPRPAPMGRPWLVVLENSNDDLEVSVIQRIKDWLHEQRIEAISRRLCRHERRAAADHAAARELLGRLLTACRERSPTQVARMQALDDARLASIQMQGMSGPGRIRISFSRSRPANTSQRLH